MSKTKLIFRPDGSALLTIPAWTKAVNETKKEKK